jgi:NarL family two-component system response regulator LiaR
MSESDISVLVVEDHAVVREGLCALINSAQGLKVIGEAADGIEAVSQAISLKPDVILMDIVMPRKGGIEAIEEIMRRNPEARILVLSSFSGDNVLRAVKAGALGYLPKESSSRELIEAIMDVHGGKLLLQPAIARRLMHELSVSNGTAAAEGQLTDREIDVLKLLARGLSNQGIADQLCLSERTVAKHIGNLLSKLGLENRTQAALYALREGLAKLE